MEITGSEAIIKAIIDEGTEVVFGYPGGAIMPCFDALFGYQDRVKHVLVRHEQGAAHAAEGYAAASGKVGVCIVTSGPGATNLVTGLADAMLDSIPIVCITGQVASGLLGTDAFQEIDVVGITTPITKWNYQITQTAEIPAVIAKAFHIAKTGRPGPVLVDITKDAQFGLAEYVHPKNISLPTYNLENKISAKTIKEACAMLDSAKQPMILAGHGVTISGAEAELMQLAEKTQIPVTLTLLGLSAFPSTHDLYGGMLGMHGNYGPNKLTNQADVILAVGMRFDDRVTSKLSTYAQNAKIIHIDIDESEINKNMKAHLEIVADAKAALLEIIKGVKAVKHDEWKQKFKDNFKIEYDKVIENEIHPQSGELTMAEIVNELSQQAKDNSIVVADVGQNQMKSARYFNFKRNRGYITSGGAGTMGFALPASIGAKFSQPDADVYAIIGDGAFQMTIQELGTIAQEKLPVKIIILNNEYLGMVRQWQELFFDKRYSFTHLHNPDFVKVAEAYGIQAKRVAERKDLKSAIQDLIESKEPYLLEFRVSKEENVFPMVPSNASVDDVRLE
jgi:acetolactate synthase-1/2/3 large subunit